MKVTFEMTKEEIETIFEEEEFEEYEDLRDMLEDQMKHEFNYYQFKVVVELIER